MQNAVAIRDYSQAVAQGRRAAWPAANAMLQSASRLPDLVADGIVELDGTSLALPENSRFLVRSVAAAFDAHLRLSQRLHSRVGRYD